MENVPFNGAVGEGSSLVLILIVIAAITGIISVAGLFPRFIKWLIAPRIEIDFAEYCKGKINRSGKEITVPSGAAVEVGIRIRPKWSYRPYIIEVLGHEQSRVTRAEIFVKGGLRPWEKPYPAPDIHGDYKLFTEGLSLKRGGVSDPTIVDVKIEPPLKSGERRNITLRIETEESRKLFVEDLWIIGK